MVADDFKIPFVIQGCRMALFTRLFVYGFIGASRYINSGMERPQ